MSARGWRAPVGAPLGSRCPRSPRSSSWWRRGRSRPYRAPRTSYRCRRRCSQRKSTRAPMPSRRWVAGHTSPRSRRAPAIWGLVGPDQSFLISRSDHQPLEEFLPELRDLGGNHGLAVRLSRIVREVILVVLLRGIELAERLYLSHDRVLPDPLRFHLGDRLTRYALLLR